MNLLILFIVLNVVNVILQTIKSIATVKCGRWMAAIINAVAYGLYTIVIVYTNCDLNLWAKVAVVACANMVGVYVVKLIEEKMRKDKLWRIEATFKHDADIIDGTYIPHSRIDLSSGYSVFTFYCATQAESAEVKKVVEKFNGKYFASESKIL